MTIEIRAAAPEDAATVLELVTALAAYENEGDKVKMTEAGARDALAAGHLNALLGFVDGRPVAMALYFFNFSSWTGKRGLFLEDLFVSPELRKQGVGLDLLKRLARLAVAEGCARVEWNVLDWNNSAKGFYEMLGARQAAGWETWRLEGEALARMGG
ncbi:GNAT family N-acetyltransferase [Sandaracinobacter sp. RS1-74]|uniref:GNAT family N-acetyltransferase n=1 Tax=Sandaracinobacteroides sayramensis TaxID=2913411 RepID=UPI001EDB2583|nr:GNAT family N-acetyltransferase [Sandaracinobacteroides sayramensis]MCG2839795.1 GNAT family N-acetyltransferase [Sandaracinobacteroides sayramensis]